VEVPTFALGSGQVGVIVVKIKVVAQTLLRSRTLSMSKKDTK
jgi:hypothetical protein